MPLSDPDAGGFGVTRVFLLLFFRYGDVLNQGLQSQARHLVEGRLCVQVYMFGQVLDRLYYLVSIHRSSSYLKTVCK
jgi:hypothetical protein